MSPPHGVRQLRPSPGAAHRSPVSINQSPIDQMTLNEIDAERREIETLLRNSVLSTETQRSEIERTAMAARESLQKECDALASEADDVRGKLRNLHRETSSLRSSLQFTTKENDKLELQHSELLAANRSLEDELSSLRREQHQHEDDAVRSPSATAAAGTTTNNNAPSSPPSAMLAIPSPARLQVSTDEAEERVLQLRSKHNGLAHDLTEVTESVAKMSQRRHTLRERLETQRSLKNRLDAMNGNDQIIEARTTMERYNSLQAQLAEQHEIAESKARERRSMVKHLLEGFKERTANQEGLRRRAIHHITSQQRRAGGNDTTEGSSAATASSPQGASRGGGNLGYLQQLLSETAALRQQTSVIIADSAEEKDSLQQYVAVLRERVAQATDTYHREAYDLEVAKEIRRVAAEMSPQATRRR